MKKEEHRSFVRTHFAPEELQQIAQVVKSNGTDGEVILSFRDISPEDFDTDTPVFIYFDGLPVPFFMESFKCRGTSKAIVRLTGTASFEDAEEIVGKGVYVEKSLIEEDGQEEDLSILEGWTLLSGESQWTVKGFIDIPENPCLEIETENGTALVPFHEDLVISLDAETQTIKMQLPEGLL